MQKIPRSKRAIALKGWTFRCKECDELYRTDGGEQGTASRRRHEFEWHDGYAVVFTITCPEGHSTTFEPPYLNEDQLKQVFEEELPADN